MLLKLYSFLISYFIKKKIYSRLSWSKIRLESEFSCSYFSIFISPFSSSIRDAKAELYKKNIEHPEETFRYSLNLFPTSGYSSLFIFASVRAFFLPSFNFPRCFIWRKIESGICIISGFFIHNHIANKTSLKTRYSK